MDEKSNQPQNLKFPKQPTENSRENQNNKPQLAPDTIRKRKETETNTLQNKPTKSAQPSSFVPKRGDQNVRQALHKIVGPTRVFHRFFFLKNEIGLQKIPYFAGENAVKLSSDDSNMHVLRHQRTKKFLGIPPGLLTERDTPSRALPLPLSPPQSKNHCSLKCYIYSLLQLCTIVNIILVLDSMVFGARPMCYGA